MWSIFKKKKHTDSAPTPWLRWKTLNHDNAGEDPHLLKKIYEDQWDGFVYRSFFSEEQCRAMLEGIAQTNTSTRTETPFGTVIGKKLDEVDGNFQKLPLDHYFRYTSKFREELPGIVGFDFENHFHEALKPLCQGVQPAVPEDDEGRTWLPATIRVCKPQQGGIQTHVGNEFNEKMADIKHLANIAKVHNQLSFFFLLQAPEAGGDLLLYDAFWDDTKEAVNQDYPAAVKAVEARPHFSVDMRAGDLVIFAGGRIWHKVNDVSGELNRVTFGGFMAFSKEMDKLYHWS